MKARVTVYLKEGVLDSQGKAVGQALSNLGYKNIHNIRVGKVFEIEMESMEPSRALSQLTGMSESLLANTVIEDFRVEIIEN